MPGRLAAAAAGVLIIVAAIVAFSLGRHPVVAGTNGVAPLSGTLSAPPGGSTCQPVLRVPAGADRLRMVMNTDVQVGLQAVITDAAGEIATGSANAHAGEINFNLSPRTRAAHAATVCFSNLGRQRVTFSGEHVRVRGPSGRLLARTTPVASVVFIKPGTSTWAGRAGTIIKRFGYVQAGPLGTWALWVAGAMAIAAAALGLWRLIAPAPYPAAPDSGTNSPSAPWKRIARIPREAWLCGLVALLNALTWSVIVPLFQVPDEQAHVSYAQYLAETGRPPAGRAGVSTMSRQERALLHALHWRSIRHRPENLPLSTAEAHLRLLRTVDAPASPSSQGGSSNASNNPPLYYAAAAAAYHLSPWTDLPTRVHAMRALSALLAGVTALLVFLFIRELLPGRPWAWTVGGLAVAFQPLFGFIGGGVNNDNLLFAAAAGVLLVLALSFRHGLTVRRGVALGGCIAVGLLTKTTMFGLLPGIALGLVLLIHRASPESRREAWKAAGVAAGITGAALLVYVALNTTVWDRGLLFGDPSGQAPGKQTLSRSGTLAGQLSYLWQFYLPRFPFMDGWFPTYEARDIWFNGFVGRFGWLDYGFGSRVYELALLVAVAVAGLAARELLRRRDAVLRRLDELATLVALVAGLLLLLAWVGYNWRLAHPGQFEQARYLLPLLGVYGAVIALAARGGARYGPAIGILLISLAIAQSAVAMLMTLTRYYG